MDIFFFSPHPTHLKVVFAVGLENLRRPTLQHHNLGRVAREPETGARRGGEGGGWREVRWDEGEGEGVDGRRSKQWWSAQDDEKILKCDAKYPGGEERPTNRPLP